MGRVFDIAEATRYAKGANTPLTEKSCILFLQKLQKNILRIIGNAKKENMIATAKIKYNFQLQLDWGKDEFLTDSPLSDVVDSFALIYTYTKLTDELKSKFREM